MTCYFRHLRPILEKAGITITKENKQEIDIAIHNLVGIEYKNCPATWKEIKQRITEDEEKFVLNLKTL